MRQSDATAARVKKVGDWVADMLSAERPAWTLYSGVAAAVVVFVLAVLGWGYISGIGAYWQQPLYDAGAHVSGWLFFKQDSWHFPIFDTSRMNYPDGGSIILTDSIPLVAFVAKLVGLVENWHYFGLFVAGAYVLNALSLLWLFWQMRVRNVAAALSAATFACFTTLYNIQFESFFAQFVVILSLGFYVRLRRRFVPRELGIFAALIVATLLIHPYLFAMSLGIFSVTLIALWRREQLSLWAGAAWLGVIVAATGLVAWASGYAAHPATGYQEHLYGTSSLFALDPTVLFRRAYSVDEIGMYLGAGFWILAIAGAVLLWRRRDVLRSHVWLVALCAAFLLLALSNTLFVNGHQVFHANLPGPVAAVAEMFRASKRFIVPLYYLVVAVGVVLLLRQKSRWGIMVVMVALAVQIADTSYFVRDIHHSASAGQPVVLDQPAWRRRIDQANIVQVFPSYSCLFDYRSAPLGQQWTASLELYQMTAQEDKISNSIRASRRTKDCEAEARLGQNIPAHGNMFIYLADDNKQFMVHPPKKCVDEEHTFEFGIYCTAP